MNENDPIDGGPIYAETHFSGWIVEPWNSLSSLAILLPAVYWAIRLKGDFRNFTFMYFMIPLLFLGGMGSMLFHAFRASRVLLVMDVLPTGIVTLAVAVYFWSRILPKWWQVPMIILPVNFLRFSMFSFLPEGLATNLSYFITGFLIFLPLLLFLFKQNFRFFSSILISVICLSMSLVFRRLDHAFVEWLPMGSHFLWHIFSGIGGFFLARYLYLLRLHDMAIEGQLATRHSN